MKLLKKTAFFIGAMIYMTLLALSFDGVAMAEPMMLDASAVAGIVFGGIVVNKANLSIIYNAFKTAFNTGFRSQTPLWPRIATLVPSSTSTEKYGWLGQWPRLSEWVGERQIKNLTLHDYSIKNKKYESSVGIGKDELEDDAYGVYSAMMQEMGFAAATHPDELVFNLLAAGFSELCYDGQYFFDTDHPVNGASTSNMQPGSGSPWFLLDTRHSLKPLIFQRRKDYDFKSMTAADDESVFMRDEFRYGIDARVNVGFAFWQIAFGSKDTLDQTNFDLAYASMLSLESDEGRPLGIMPDVLVCGPSQRAAANALLEAQFISGGTSNTNFKAVELIVVPWLA
jgi:phage major head subunit gpT-like protein